MIMYNIHMAYYAYYYIMFIIISCEVLAYEIVLIVLVSFQNYCIFLGIRTIFDQTFFY